MADLFSVKTQSELLELLKSDEIVSMEEYVNKPSVSTGITPLIHYLTNENYECMETLLNNGADPNLEANGIIPLHEAYNIDLWPTAILLNYGADPNIKNKKGDTILDIMAREAKLMDNPKEYIYNMFEYYEKYNLNIASLSTKKLLKKYMCNIHYSKILFL